MTEQQNKEAWLATEVMEFETIPSSKAKVSNYYTINSRVVDDTDYTPFSSIEQAMQLAMSMKPKYEVDITITEAGYNVIAIASESSYIDYTDKDLCTAICECILKARGYYDD